MALLSKEQAEHELAAVRWTLDGNEIYRELSFKNFLQAVTFTNQVAELAEQQQHHPDILIHSWNQVKLTLSTHSEGGLTVKDFQLAAAIDQLVGL